MNTKLPQRGIWHGQLVGLILSTTIGLLIYTLWKAGITEAAIRENIRWTAQIGFTCFCIAFSASSVHLILHNSFSFWLLMNRKYWGISFALVHILHLIFLGLLQWSFHPIFTEVPLHILLPGIIAYGFTFLMLLTSFKRVSNHLRGSLWKWLHLIGGYWIWGVFFISYLGRAINEIEHLPYILILLFVIGIRIYRFFRFRQE